MYLLLMRRSLFFQPGLTVDTDIAVTLDSVCLWQTTWNPPADDNPDHVDYVILLTR